MLRSRRELKESSDLGECGARALNHYLPEAHAEHTVIEDPGVAALQGQSTFLRKFDEGERNRQRVDLQLQIMLTDALAATPTFSYRYDYIASRMGLQEMDEGVERLDNPVAFPVRPGGPGGGKSP